MFHPEGGSPRDETSRCARRQELNLALSAPGARFLFFWIEFLLSFPTQHQLRTLLLLRASACSLSSHENLCSCGSPVAPNCVHRIVWLTCVLLKWVLRNSGVWVCSVENSLLRVQSQHSQRSIPHLFLSDQSFVHRARKCEETMEWGRVVIRHCCSHLSPEQSDQVNGKRSRELVRFNNYGKWAVSAKGERREASRGESDVAILAVLGDGFRLPSIDEAELMELKTIPHLVSLAVRRGHRHGDRKKI
jgi:hypothetical protein